MLIESTDTDFPVCPYCGKLDRDPQDIESDSTDDECWNCESTYHVERVVTVTYTTTKIPSDQ